MALGEHNFIRTALSVKPERAVVQNVSEDPLNTISSIQVSLLSTIQLVPPQKGPSVDCHGRRLQELLYISSPSGIAHALYLIPCMMENNLLRRGWVFVPKEPPPALARDVSDHGLTKKGCSWHIHQYSF